ncbi:DUF1772 domain-containing protein [[Mycobacterium] burgundiense]|jgi:hypothetical protein|uniref:DUF1772 domain-containing protein n=1 Tax=[Mycobacterium] burgundiense TaxID=3064286 RepID=A0ABN9N8Z0_9MYCO|nr:DUF1772 domain-containing protein [Mycolicibacterium sp. MU0053]CAJ1502457.1 DUF1772 domain-containing protein [Mycolicibacterium sp. MU0053]
MREIIEVIALVLAGPLAGVEFAVAAFTHPVLGRLPDGAFAQARSDDARVLGKAMPFWYVATLVALIAAAVLSGGDWLETTAAALMAIVVLITVTLMVPINNRIGRWVGAADVSRDEARRWDRLHAVRVALLFAVFGLLVFQVGG